MPQSQIRATQLIPQGFFDLSTLKSNCPLPMMRKHQFVLGTAS